MPIFELRDVELSFGGPALLDHLDFSIERGERIALIGRNGAGKSTLMKTITGEVIPESGEIRKDSSLRIARLEQDLPDASTELVYDIVVDGLPAVADLLHRYHHLVNEISAGSGDLDALSRVQSELEAGEGWSLHQRVESTLSRMNLDGEIPFADLSGGLKRRVLLARSLVSEPDLLLLDEPTNHLDIEAIRWLEDFLLGFSGALLFVTHDRAFLKRLATRIVELDRGRLLDFPGNYERFLEHRDQALAAEAKADAHFDKKLAEEEAWIRQGIKARRTRNEGRVRALKKMRDERAQRRSRQGNAQFDIEAAKQSGKIVFEAKQMSFSYPGTDEQGLIVKDMNALVMRGDKVGLIGPNGVGKSTVLKLLLGDLEPTDGKLRRGVNLEVAYFDQSRAQLNLEASVADNVSEGRDFIELGGKRKHIMSYLQDFLFAADRARQPVKSLSGGERNRLLLARLFSKPSNLLVLDEPTNDLDMETLELLEERLVDYPGTVLLVSHDRDFLDNVVSDSLVFEGHATVRDYVGGYSDWLRQRQEPSIEPAARKSTTDEAAQSVKTSKSKKLSYKDSRELAELPKRIEKTEKALEALHETFASPDFYQKDASEIAQAQQKAKALEDELEVMFERWETLENASG